MTDTSDALNQCCENTDREIWREREGDYYADSIHVTRGGSIGIQCGGTVVVMPVRKWHALAIAEHERQDRRHAPQVNERDALLYEALRVLYEETADYIRINHLGDVHHNRSMQLARAALAGRE